jgi:hypothetical protein
VVEKKVGMPGSLAVKRLARLAFVTRPNAQSPLLAAIKLQR